MRGIKTKSIWVLALLLLAGIVLGGFIGDYLSAIPALSWLGYGKNFGLLTPFLLDLGVLKLQFALSIRFTIAGILGILLAGFIYRKL